MLDRHEELLALDRIPCAIALDRSLQLCLLRSHSGNAHSFRGE